MGLVTLPVRYDYTILKQLWKYSKEIFWGEKILQLILKAVNLLKYLVIVAASISKMVVIFNKLLKHC